jgi:ubiquinone/menaquinone biosynthesis C-methylase UbiE
MLNVARQKKLLNVEYILGDASALPFQDESVPLIVSVTMLEFVSDLKKVVDEMYRVLKPGGMLMLGCLNILSELGKNSQKDEVFKHARLFSPSEVELIVARFGEPRLSYGVYYTPDFKLLDNTDRQNQVEPAFMVASAIKTK